MPSCQLLCGADSAGLVLPPLTANLWSNLRFGHTFSSPEWTGIVHSCALSWQLPIAKCCPNSRKLLSEMPWTAGSYAIQFVGLTLLLVADGTEPQRFRRRALRNTPPESHGKAPRSPSDTNLPSISLAVADPPGKLFTCSELSESNKKD